MGKSGRNENRAKRINSIHHALVWSYLPFAMWHMWCPFGSAVGGCSLQHGCVIWMTLKMIFCHRRRQNLPSHNPLCVVDGARRWITQPSLRKRGQSSISAGKSEWQASIKLLWFGAHVINNHVTYGLLVKRLTNQLGYDRNLMQHTEQRHCKYDQSSKERTWRAHEGGGEISTSVRHNGLCHFPLSPHKHDPLPPVSCFW